MTLKRSDDSSLQAKRKALDSVDKKLTALGEARAVKDDEMKELERTLVEVLVEQQKKLLALLAEVNAPLLPVEPFSAIVPMPLKLLRPSVPPSTPGRRQTVALP